MPLETYIDKNFSAASRGVIDMANVIIEEYQAQGFTLTLRQLYYQFVSRALLPNTQRSYKRLGSIVNDARLAGLIDWNAIVDRTRNLASAPHWDTPGEIIESAAQGFHLDLWEGQEMRVEVWIEKEALVGVIENVCRELDVPWFACRGYVSQSEQWRAGKRAATHAADGQDVVILHLGDHDPSGIDMTRDNESRLDLFSRRGRVTVQRLALNMNQVDQYSPPPNPAKTTDSRYEGYIAAYGDESWELDALEPRVISALIGDAINEHLDEDLFQARKDEQEEGRTALLAAASSWDEVVAWLDRQADE